MRATLSIETLHSRSTGLRYVRSIPELYVWPHRSSNTAPKFPAPPSSVVPYILFLCRSKTTPANGLLPSGTFWKL